jgi:hypothetical protein
MKVLVLGYGNAVSRRRRLRASFGRAVLLSMAMLRSGKAAELWGWSCTYCRSFAEGELAKPRCSYICDASACAP